MSHRRKKPLPKELRPTQRINQILSLAGITSRRKADDLLKSARVSVNGKVIREPGTQAVWGRDSIRVDGREIPAPSDRIYLMLNKPAGYVSSLKDPAGRPVVTDLLTDVRERVYLVGRLDFDTLGLLLLTNDGEWTHRLSHPRFHVPRTYKVTLEGTVSDEALEILRKGVDLEDGFSGPAKVVLVRREQGRTILRMTITSGKKHIVKRMADAVGFRVIHLLRTGFGVLELGRLKVGTFRHLEPDEVEAMKKLVGLA